MIRIVRYRSVLEIGQLLVPAILHLVLAREPEREQQVLQFDAGR